MEVFALNWNLVIRLSTASLISLMATACDLIPEEEDEGDLAPPCTTTVTKSVDATTTWGDDCRVYSVPDYTNVSADLTIRAGTKVVFGPSAGLEVREGGSLSAVGTETRPIVFEGVEHSKSYWGGVGFLSNSSKNELTWVRFADGGGSGHHFRYYALLVAGRAKITNTVVENVGTDALVVDKGASLAGYAANTFRGIDGFPVTTWTSGLGDLDGASSYAGTVDAPNAKAFIKVDADTVKNSQTWASQDVPYRFAGYHAVNDADSVVTIEPGAQLSFEEEAGIDVAAGALSAVGTEALPIVFRGVDASKGYWGGIAFRSNSSKNELSFARVEDGGASGHHFRYYALLVQGRVKITNTIVGNVKGDALVVDKGANLEGYANNQFVGITGFPVDLYANGVGQLDGESDYASATNDKPWVKVGAETVTRTQTWLKQSVPYRFSGTTSINDASAQVTVEPGARLEFEEESGLNVDAGALFAEGTEGARIVFTGVDKTKGFWSGLAILSNASKNVLDYAEVSYGGASGYHFTYQGIRVIGSLTLKNSIIKDNKEAGVRVLKGAVLNVSGPMTYSNNGNSSADDVVDLNP